MFIFTMFFSLLMLPFTLLRMVFGLFGISTRILLLPLKIFARNPVLCIGIAVVVIIYLAIKSDPHSIDTLKPKAPAETQAAQQPKGMPPLIESVTTREDGDSAFATDTYSMMTEPERNYYSAIFYKVMSTSPDGEKNDWTNGNTNGALRPTRTFKNNVGVICRSFTEVLKVHRIEQTISGTACAQPGGSWCKLKPNATPSCGLGHTPGAFDGLGNAVKNLF